jgi:thiamine-phosphate pyrophosphorylase
LQSHPLGEAALTLRETYMRSNKPASRLSPLIAMSDPIRTPDILSWAESLPENCALIYRFHQFDLEVARSLRAISIRKKQQFLIRAEEPCLPCDGQHFIRNTPISTLTAFKQAYPKKLITLAGLKEGAYSEPLPKLDGLLVSSIFPSQSPSAGSPIGTESLAEKARQYSVPIYALGGVNQKNAAQLNTTGIAGIACVGAFSKHSRKKVVTMSLDAIKISKSVLGNTIQFTARHSEHSDKAVLDMRLISDGLYNAHHTGVPKSMGGKGVGTALVKAMVDDAATQGYKVHPGCPFIAAWFKRKPEWATLAADAPEKYKR